MNRADRPSVRSVVIAHNFYRSQSPSGENNVVEADVHRLRAAGLVIVPFFRYSDSIVDQRFTERAQLPLGSVYHPSGVRELGRILDATGPDILHLHNWLPLISPAAVHVARSRGVAVVHTVHNQRHHCVAGTYFRGGETCTECRDVRHPGPALRYGCYQGSRLKTAPVALGQIASRSIWNGVHRWVALTEWSRKEVELWGVAEHRIAVLPTAAPDTGAGLKAAKRAGVLFVGRLDDQKGIRCLLSAWARLPLFHLGGLTILGEGPLTEEVRSAAVTRRDISFAGASSPSHVAEAMQRSELLVLPSLSPEGFPRVLAEAYCASLPALVSSNGSLPELVARGRGWVYAGGSSELASALQDLSRRMLSEAGQVARRYFEETLETSANTRRLIEVYQSAVLDKLRGDATQNGPFREPTSGTKRPKRR